MMALHIPGPPQTKGRPRFGNGRTYTDKRTLLAEQDIRHAWEQAGQPCLGDGPIALSLTVAFARPKSHLRKDGSLSATGRRFPWPTKRPDLDNTLKLFADSLNRRAWMDDAQIVTAYTQKVWASELKPEGVHVEAYPLDQVTEVAA